MGPAACQNVDEDARSGESNLWSRVHLRSSVRYSAKARDF